VTAGGGREGIPVQPRWVRVTVFVVVVLVALSLAMSVVPFG
jgi:hypothetical protein